MASEPKKLEALPKERFCPNCGKSMGRPKYHDRFDTCGAVECEREARDAYLEEQEYRRDEAEADGYSRY